MRAGWCRRATVQPCSAGYRSSHLPPSPQLGWAFLPELRAPGPSTRGPVACVPRAGSPDAGAAPFPASRPLCGRHEQRTSARWDEERQSVSGAGLPGMTIFLHPIGTMKLASPQGGLVLTAGGGVWPDGRIPTGFQETLRDDPAKASPKTRLGGLASSLRSPLGAVDGRSAA